MDARMYPLATYLREIRQDWPLHAIQTALADVDGMPYQHIAVAAVRAAVDPTTERPGRIKRFAELEASGSRTAGPPRMCQTCHRMHDPARPDEHPTPLGETWTRQAAAEARAALQRAKETLA